MHLVMNKNMDKFKELKRADFAEFISIVISRRGQFSEPVIKDFKN